MVELEEPDKGRAWLIAISACIINTILSGLSRMVGILYVSVIDTYGVTRAEATLPFTIRNSVRCLSGPLVGILGERFGIRTVTFWGGVLASAGAALCSIAPNVTWLAIFWGGMHGLGFALANTLFQVVVNQYFQKYRATASGIALSGACVGSLAFPFMLEAILDAFGLSGGFLIMGGIVMHVLPPALLLTKPQWVEYPEAYARLYNLKKSRQVSDTGSSRDLIIGDVETSEQVQARDRKMARTTSLSNCPIESVEVYKFSRQNRQRERDTGVFDYPSKRRSNSAANVLCTGYRKAESPTTEKKYLTQSFNGSPSDQNLYQSTGKIQRDATISIEKDAAAPQQAPDPQSSSAQPETLLHTLKRIAYLYLNPMYVLISMCMTSYVLIFIPILTVLVDYSKDKGISANYGKYLINAMAIGDLAGRLCFGWVTDRKFLTIPKYLMLILCLQGLFVVLFSAAMSLASFMTVLVLYSMMAGALIVIFPVLVLEYMNSSSQSLAMACIGFLSGIISFGSPPTIGYFRDYVGSYDGMFYITGGISIVCGVLWLLEPIVVRVSHIQKNSDSHESDLTIVQNEQQTDDSRTKYS